MEYDPIFNGLLHTVKNDPTFVFNVNKINDKKRDKLHWVKNYPIFVGLGLNLGLFKKIFMLHLAKSNFEFKL